jgi:hypothetical protein
VDKRILARGTCRMRVILNKGCGKLTQFFDLKFTGRSNRRAYSFSVGTLATRWF